LAPLIYPHLLLHAATYAVRFPDLSSVWEDGNAVGTADYTRITSTIKELRVR